MESIKTLHKTGNENVDNVKVRLIQHTQKIVNSLNIACTGEKYLPRHRRSFFISLNVLIFIKSLILVGWRASCDFNKGAKNNRMG